MIEKNKNKIKNILTEGLDYYFNEQGYWVFTEKYLLDRGYCCNNKCKHCPYNNLKKTTEAVVENNADGS